MEEGHGGPHADGHGVWEVTSSQPDRAAQVADIQARTAIAEELSGAGFTREELTAATATQQKVAPSKDEILAAIHGAHGPWVSSVAIHKALTAVEKLYADRGL